MGSYLRWFAHKMLWVVLYSVICFLHNQQNQYNIWSNANPLKLDKLHLHLIYMYNLHVEWSTIYFELPIYLPLLSLTASIKNLNFKTCTQIAIHSHNWTYRDHKSLLSSYFGSHWSLQKFDKLLTWATAKIQATRV